MPLGFIVILLGMAALNLVATVVILRAVGYAPGQRRAQLLLIWLLPVVGAALVLSIVPSRPVLRSHEDTTSDGGGDFVAGTCGGGSGCGGGGDGGH